MKLLVISQAGIGDTLFATPFLHELRANFPGAQIDAFVRWRGSKDVLENNPHVNAVHQHDLLQRSPVESLRFLRGLRRQKYDVSFNTHPQSKIHYRLVARFIGAPKRASHLYDHSGRLDGLLVNRTVPQNYERHAIENNLELLALIGAKRVQAWDVAGIWLFPSVIQMSKISAGAEYSSGAPVGMRRCAFRATAAAGAPAAFIIKRIMTNALPCARCGLRWHGSPR